MYVSVQIHPDLSSSAYGKIPLSPLCYTASSVYVFIKTPNLFYHNVMWWALELDSPRFNPNSALTSGVDSGQLKPWFFFFQRILEGPCEN